MAVDSARLGTRAAAIYGEVGSQLQKRLGPLSLRSRHFTTPVLPFCSFLSIGRDVTNPDEDIAISIDVTPGCQTLDVSIVWGRDGLILADDELPLDASSTEGLDEAMAQAAEFLTMHVDVIAEALVSLTDRDEPT